MYWVCHKRYQSCLDDTIFLITVFRVNKIKTFKKKLMLGTNFCCIYHLSLSLSFQPLLCSLFLCFKNQIFCLFSVNGQWSEWSDWTKCSNTHAPFCDHTRTRTCQLPPGVLSGNPVCVGGNLEKRDCACKLTFHFQQKNK